jgi:hypothetical protein
MTDTISTAKGATDASLLTDNSLLRSTHSQALILKPPGKLRSQFFTVLAAARILMS